MKDNHKFFYILKKKYSVFLNEKNDKQRLITKSFLQFYLQTRSRKLISIIITEIICFSLLPFFLIYLILISKKSRININRNDVQLTKFNSENFILPKTEQNVQKIILCERNITLKDLKLIYDILSFSFKIKLFWNFQFIFKIINEISLHNNYINHPNIRRVFVYYEFDCSISILKYLFNQRKKKLINVQHGEQIISAHYCFVEIDEFYVWKKFYKDIFQNKMFCISKFKIFKKYKKRKKKEVVNKNIGVLEPQKAHFEKPKTFNKFINEFIKTITELNRFYDVTFRTHPRYYDQKIISKIKNANIKIQFSTKTKVNEFLKKNCIIIGTPSALLNDAYYNGNKIFIIDCDYSKMLSKYHYFYKSKRIIKIQNFTKILENLYKKKFKQFQ